MIFLDTCVWFELLGVRTPEKEYEKMQTKIASNLLKKIMNSEKKIITCKEQILELITATENAKRKEYNKNVEDGQKKVGSNKEFRKKAEFASVKELCKSIVDDLNYFAEITEIEYNVDEIIEKLDLVDINDGIYYEYCLKNNVDFYTFDLDFTNLVSNNNIHLLDCKKENVIKRENNIIQS